VAAFPIVGRPLKPGPARLATLKLIFDAETI
jgi:hypothetical protein